jgi:hypothetical protein
MTKTKKQEVHPRNKLRNLEAKINKDDLDYGVSDDEIDDNHTEEIESEEMNESESDVDEDLTVENSDDDEQNEKKVDKSKVKKGVKNQKVKSNDVENIPDLVPATKESRRERYEYKPEITKTLIIMDPTNRITKEYMTKFEYTEVISQRAKQIENGGESFTDVTDISDPLEIAKKEIFDKKCPLSVRRHLTFDICEQWDINELSIPDL